MLASCRLCSSVPITVPLPLGPQASICNSDCTTILQAHLPKSLFPISQVPAQQSDLPLWSLEDSELKNKIKSFFFPLSLSTKLITLRKIKYQEFQLCNGLSAANRWSGEQREFRTGKTWTQGTHPPPSFPPLTLSLATHHLFRHFQC